MAGLVDIDRARSAFKSGQKSSNVLALMSNWNQVLDRMLLAKQQLSGQKELAAGREEAAVRAEERREEADIRAEDRRQQANKDLVTFEEAEKDRAERKARAAAQARSGEAFREFSDFYVQGSTADDPKVAISALMRANTVLSGISKDDLGYLTSFTPKDVQSQINQLMQNMRDTEKNDLRREIEGLRGQLESPKEIQARKQEALETMAAAKIKEIGGALADDPDSAGALFLDAVTENPELLQTEAWQEYGKTLKTLGAIKDESDAKGLLGSEMTREADALVNALYTPGGGALFDAFEGALPDEIEERLGAVVLAEGTGLGPISPIQTLIAPGARSTKVGFKDTQDYIQALQGEMSLWSRSGFAEDSENNILKPEVRSRIFHDVMDDTIKKAKSNRKGLRTRESVEPAEVMEYEGKLQRAKEGLTKKGTTKEQVMANFAAIDAHYRGQGVDIADVFDVMGWEKLSEIGIP